jgi:hypothetical protein
MVTTGSISSRSLIFIVKFSSYVSTPSEICIQILYISCVSKSYIAAALRLFPEIEKLPSSTPEVLHARAKVRILLSSPSSIPESVPIVSHRVLFSSISWLVRLISVGARFISLIFIVKASSYIHPLPSLVAILIS